MSRHGFGGGERALGGVRLDDKEWTGSLVTPTVRDGRHRPVYEHDWYAYAF